MEEERGRSRCGGGERVQKPRWIEGNRNHCGGGQGEERGRNRCVGGEEGGGAGVEC